MRILILMLLAGSAFAGETAIHNVSGYTSTSSGIREFSVLVFSESGRVVATGGESLLNEHPDAIRIDGNGRSLLPGLIDAHGHVYNLGFLQVTLNLIGIPSVEDAVASIESYAKANPTAAWIVGRGWNQVLWPVKEFPKATQIDAVVRDRPVWLRRVDGHAGWANSRALEIAGIDDDTPDPVGGKIVRDARGKATGVLIDMAMPLVQSRIPPSTKEEIREYYRSAISTLLSYGMTGVHDMGVTLPMAEVFLAMADDDELDMRITAFLDSQTSAHEKIGKPIRGYGDEKLDLAAVKIYADGALGSRGAAMIEPYSDDVENRGLAFFAQDELEAMTTRANDLGFQVGTHAIGDLGNRMVLDAFEAAQGGKPSPLRNRIEHAQVIALDDIPRFAELGVIASMQPTHATSDMNMAEDRVGPDRIAGAYAWRRMLDTGAVLAAGSDFVVEHPNPFYGLYSAVTRQDHGGNPKGGWYIDQGLTRAEALHAYTLAAAYAGRREDSLGSLEPGKWADFIVTEQDYFEVPASDIYAIKVLETWVAGEKVYAAEDTQ